MKRLLVALGLLAGCQTSFNFKQVDLWTGPEDVCGPKPTEEEIIAAAQEYADGNFQNPESAVIAVTGDLQPIEFVFVHGEESVYAWRAWVTISRQLKSGSHTANQSFGFAIKNGLRLASWYPESTYTKDGTMPRFSFAPKFSERDGRR